MAKFFIDRPIFAWVIALFIIVLGLVSITQLPIAQYPPVAPPAIIVSATYPGASAQTLEDSVLSVIEQEMNGSPGMIYMESVAQANGSGNITLSFQQGTHPDLAQVDVQNRLARATPRLPAAVTQQGVRVDKSRSNFLLFTILSSDDPAMTPVMLGDYASRTVLPEIQRLPGVGQADQLRCVSGRGQCRHPRPERTGVGRVHRRSAQHRRPGHCGHGGGRWPAHVGRAVRQRRVARQHRRLHRAAQGRGQG
jgi:multidrug efflux pump